ncbi:MAG: WbqC family protein [Saprospiraceae bacterium]|nr:WbqC family protein [Saprospiraceae bacterium]
MPLPVLPAYYLPDAFFFYLGMQSKVILIEANENYQKNSFRNRCDILSANGPLSLSVPLRKGKILQCLCTK